MANCFSAAVFKRELASYARLELIESPASRQLEQPPAAHDACPSADDLLDFCQGSLPASRTLSVQHHLDACPTCMDIATLALNDWEARAPGEWHDVARNFKPGDCVDDRYEIVRFLASGGMGEVYEAIDNRTSRRVALKAILAAASDSREALESFRREGRLARRVRHPHVCHVHRAPFASDVIARPLVPYFAMDLIDGDTLQERLGAGPLPLEQTLAIARQLLHGIQAIHRAGVLHLDIKSSNVMLHRAPTLHAVILDFGLARRTAGGASSEGPRPLSGSLPYMPPEQMLGLAPGVQNDIFAFGVVLFQMLTGELPFADVQASPQASMAKRLTAKAPAPSQIVSAVPRRLDEVVRRCLAKRKERFREVGAVMEALA